MTTTKEDAMSLKMYPHTRPDGTVVYVTVPDDATCPEGCGNHDAGTCPRCFENTGIGCAHGPLCADCREDITTTEEG
jgi:hypothetical protein